MTAPEQPQPPDVGAVGDDWDVFQWRTLAEGYKARHDDLVTQMQALGAERDRLAAALVEAEGRIDAMQPVVVVAVGYVDGLFHRGDLIRVVREQAAATRQASAASDVATDVSNAQEGE